LKILGIIPARGGSKGVPRKNIKLLNGKPLIAYTIEEAKKSAITDIIVSSEDKEILDISKQYGALVPFTRPESLSRDTTPTIDVVKHAILKLKEQNIEYDAVCILQVTTPFRDYKLIDRCINEFLKNESDSVFSVREVPSHLNPHWVFLLDGEKHLKIATGDKEIIKRRQELPKAFYRDGSVYITNIKTVLESNSLYGNKIGYVVNSNAKYINIDTIEDWELALELVEK